MPEKLKNFKFYILDNYFGINKLNYTVNFSKSSYEIFDAV